MWNLNANALLLDFVKVFFGSHVLSIALKRGASPTPCRPPTLKPRGYGPHSNRPNLNHRVAAVAKEST